MTLEEKAQALADSLGISVWLTPDGSIRQKDEGGAGREFRPRDTWRKSPLDKTTRDEE